MFKCKPENHQHPERKGIHIVGKTLSSGEVIRYIYSSRGGSLIGRAAANDDVEEIIKAHISKKRTRVINMLIKGCEKRAMMKGREFSLTSDWLNDRLHQSADRCEVTALPFDYGKLDEKNPNAPSIDRIDNSIGYVPENVRIVLHSLNVAMNVWGLDYYLKVAEAAVSNRLSSS